MILRLVGKIVTVVRRRPCVRRMADVALLRGAEVILV